jgi:hypothetical protein
MKASNDNVTERLSWERWWIQFTGLYEEAKSHTKALRHGLTVLRVSDFAAQFYCEQRLELQLFLRAERLKAWERRTSPSDVEGRADPLAVGVRGHGMIADGGQERPVGDVWKAVINGDRVRLHDPLLLGKFEEIFLSGHPDVVVFSDQAPNLVIEYKFSAKGIPSAYHHSQANLYCYLLDDLGFDVRNLHYVLAIFPPDCDDADTLHNATDFIDDRFPFQRMDLPLSKGKARFNAYPYDRADAIKELTWASGYWRSTREAIPTKLPWKCRACSAKKVCPSSLASE